MTVGQLFREIAAEFGHTNESLHKYADTVAPSSINIELTYEEAEALRPVLRAEAAKIEAMPLDEAKALLHRHFSRN